MDDAQKAIILNILANHNIMTLATVRPDGFPQATTVYYINEGLTLYFATHPASQKAGNIKLNNKVSVAIAAETKNANKLKALSLSGQATRILDAEQTRALRILLFQSVPAAKRFAPANSKDLLVYAIKPIAISLVDYTTGYGKTFLIEL